MSWRCLYAFAIAALLLAAPGCSPHLAGTNDAALVYALEAAAGGTASGAAVGTAGDAAPMDLRTAARRVKARLIAAGVTADVERLEEGPPSLRVVIDAEEADAVNALVLWRGDVALYPVTDEVTLAPADTSDLRHVAGGDPAAADKGWQGPSAAVARAIRDGTLDGAASSRTPSQASSRAPSQASSHIGLLEPLGDGQARTHVASLPALTELAEHASAPATMAGLDLADGGRALALSFTPDAQKTVRAFAQLEPKGLIAVARGRTVLSLVPIAQALETPLIFTIAGDRGIETYSHAYRVRELLSSPILPVLTPTSATRLPIRFGLAAACALLPFALSFGWLLFLRRFDRRRPEPMWLVSVTFALGGVSVVPAALVEVALSATTPWLDPSVVTMGGQLRALPLAIAVFTITVGLVEETAKWLAAWSLAAHRREFDEPVDGIIYGCAAALGFAAVENVKYFALGRMSGVVIAARTFMTVPAHMFFGAIWGYAMGRHLLAPREGKGPWLRLFGLAALAHGVFDATLSTEGLQLLATPLVLVLAVTFVALLRLALRHGPISAPRPDTTPPATPIATFRVGSAAAFYSCAATMVLAASAVTLLGSYYELLHHRVGVGFVTSASALLALFGMACYGTSESLPLDVVVDALGFTFAGEHTPWAAVAGVELLPWSPRRAFVQVALADRSIRLGPAPAQRAEALASALAKTSASKRAGKDVCC